MSMESFLKDAANVRPSARQLSWFNTEFYAFVHFCVNTYTDREWGLGDEDEAIFNPTELDCDQWVEAIKSAGMKGMILTAKHHDGFCLWPSAYTEHSVKNSPWKNGKGDVVREAAEACRRGGIQFGFYLSPWDRNSKLYGTDAYNDYYKAQLTELLTQYGDIFMVWFDGACGEGPNGRKQEYDFQGYIDLIRKYQPNAVIFNDHGPDVRWIGNESGTARFAEWAVTPSELTYLAETQTGPGPLKGDLSFIYNTYPDIGSMSSIMYSKGLCFCASEVDMSIRPGWFYHSNEEPHSLERLMRTYITSVGGNTSFNLNIPPMPNGKFDERDVARLKELGNAIQSAFGTDLATDSTQEWKQEPGATQAVCEITLPEKRMVHYVALREKIEMGQRVESFIVQLQDEYGQWNTAYMGTTIGHKRICQIPEWFGKTPVDKIRVTITGARAEAEMLPVQVF